MTRAEIKAEHAKRATLEELMRKLGIAVEHPGCGSAVLTEQLVRAFEAPSEVERAARDWAAWERALRVQGDACEAGKPVDPEARRRVSVMADYTEQRLLDLCESRKPLSDGEFVLNPRLSRVVRTLVGEG